tara:strand:+ start:1040 stop:1471 length:432 start_codon:yes stop_codon:yes gene_type:complete
MSCELPVHSVSQSELRAEILENAKKRYRELVGQLEQTSQVGTNTNGEIISLMNELLVNNKDNARIIEERKGELDNVKKSVKVNKMYLQSLRDSIDKNEDTKLVISNRISTGKERTEDVSKKFTIYLSIVIVLFLVELGLLFFV